MRNSFNLAFPVLTGLLLCTFSVCTVEWVFGQEPAIEKKLREEGARVEVYKATTNSSGEPVELNIYLFEPEDHKPTDKRPAVVFFFGGGWRSGTPAQFLEHCKHLASMGMVAATADYRVASRHGTKAVSCVNDGKSAVRWLRKNAERLGIDPQRVAAGGGSAGGHVAACTGVIGKFDETTEDDSISSVPDALLLFNPAIGLALYDERSKATAEKLKALKTRIGVEPIEVSPLHHVKAGIPPTIIFHGKADTTVPYWTVEAFAGEMDKAGNRCELVGYEGQPHGFFNYGRNEGRYKETVAEMDKFLKSLGYIE